MALVTQSNNAFNDAALAPFTGVNNGTARLLKAISATELAALQEGDIVYVESVRDYWKWLPNSTITSNNITYCAPTVVGAGAGRFERLMIASPDWALQTEWHIASTGNDENSGLAGFPLLTTEERRRRWGDNFQLADSTAYHIRYLTDNYSDVIDARRGTNSVIYCHGSVNDFEGATPPLYSGSVTAITALNIATGQPYVVNSAGLAVNWAGLIDARIRVTSGANVKALSSAFFQDTGTAKSAWCDEFLTPAASLSVAPFVAPGTAQAPPSAGDTFVVENLRVVTRLQINVINPPNSTTTTISVVLDSIQCTNLIGSPSSAVYVYGCKPGTPLVQTPCFYSFRACIFANLALFDTGTKNITGGHVNGSLVLINNLPSNSSSVQNFSLSGASFLFFGGSGNGTSPDTWRPGQIGAHNHVNAPLVVCGGGVRMGSAWAPYGIGNSAALWAVEQNCVGIAQSGSWTASSGYQTTSTNIWQTLSTPAKASLPAFDTTTGIYTGVRLLSAANMQATVLAGGFDYQAIDPSTGAGFIKY